MIMHLNYQMILSRSPFSNTVYSCILIHVLEDWVRGSIPSRVNIPSIFYLSYNHPFWGGRVNISGQLVGQSEAELYNHWPLSLTCVLSSSQKLGQNITLVYYRIRPLRGPWRSYKWPLTRLTSEWNLPCYFLYFVEGKLCKKWKKYR